MNNPGKTLICECGNKFRTSIHCHKDRAHLCKECGEVARLKWIEDDRKKQLATKKSELRKWFKWVCKERLYHPSIKIKQEMDKSFSAGVYRALVLEIEKPVYTKYKQLAGCEWPTHEIVHGYFRVTFRRNGCDGLNIYYPDWAAGITNEKLGSGRKRFDEWMSQCAHKNYIKTHQIKMERDLLKRIQKTSDKVDDLQFRVRQIMANRAEIKYQAARKAEQRKESMIRDHAQNERMRAAKKYKGSFFQMQAASQAISDYAKTTNKTTA